jgi:L-2-hydroxyglutarate oxidase LhgO
VKKSVVIIGAGVVGCAVAQKISELGYEPFILEAGPRIAEGVTSRNSGVIHAGIYYKPNSLKANSCIRGSKLLYEWCSEKQVPHKKNWQIHCCAKR